MITAKQYVRYLEQLEISRRRASKMLGIDYRTSRRYANDDTPIPEPINIILRLMLKHRYSADDIEALRKEKM